MATVVPNLVLRVRPLIVAHEWTLKWVQMREPDLYYGPGLPDVARYIGLSRTENEGEVVQLFETLETALHTLAALVDDLPAILRAQPVGVAHACWLTQMIEGRVIVIDELYDMLPVGTTGRFASDFAAPTTVDDEVVFHAYVPFGIDGVERRERVERYTFSLASFVLRSATVLEAADNGQ